MTQTPAEKADVDERLSALLTNAAAVQAIAGAVENTLGPKGLDTMLVDAGGDIVVTNAGVTILDRMEVSHPAARMLIGIARNQHRLVGDGTTTATIMAGTLVNEGLNRIIKGVPVTKVLEGINEAVDLCLQRLQEKAIPIQGLSDGLLEKSVFIAGRQDREITGAILRLARCTGEEKLKDPSFRLADRILCQVGAPYEVFEGLVIKKRPLNSHMPRLRENIRVLLLEDGLLPEEIGESALGTEAGFAAHVRSQQQFRKNLEKLEMLGVGLVIAEKRIDDYAEEYLTARGIPAFNRIHGAALREIAEYTGCRPVSRSFLELPPEAMEKSLGSARGVSVDMKWGQMRLWGGGGADTATFIVGATTEEVAGERERIAQDAAASLQSSLKEGIVAGGGSFEISLLESLTEKRARMKNLAAYGIDCVMEALKRPMAQILSNAGINSLEKMEEVAGRFKEEPEIFWGVDCDSGKVSDMLELGITDPALVKKHALMAAREVACTILKINTIIKMKEIRRNF